MLNEQTMNKLMAMKLDGMAKEYDRQKATPSSHALSFEERLAALVESQWISRENRALERRLKNAKLKIQASIEDLDWRHPRGLDREVVNALATSDWVRYKRNCVITGPTGVGKSFLACALANKACRDGYKVNYFQSPKLFREMIAARADGSLNKFFRKAARTDLIVIDDFGLETADQRVYRDFLELIDERHQTGAFVITSQYPCQSWHELVEDQTVADAILDRLVHNSHIIEMEGESMRKLRAKKKA